MYTYEYPRPILTADCVVVRDGAVLLVRRGNDPYKGCWALPGGFMEMDETIEHCAARYGTEINIFCGLQKMSYLCITPNIVNLG